MEYTIKTINELCTKITDGSHFSPEHETDGLYPMYSVKDMEYNNFSNADCKMIGQAMFDKLSKADCRPLKNDILIAKDGSYLKCAFKVNEDLNACILSSIAILRPNLKKIDPDYFVYLMRTKSIKGAMANYVSGSALPRIILSDFKKMKLKMILSLPTQQKIASILTAYDNLIQNYKKQIEALQTAASELYKEWFVRFRFPGWQNANFENGIPEGWKYLKLSEFGYEVESGNRPAGGIDDSLEDGIPSLGAESIDKLGYFDYSNVKLVPREFYDKMKRGHGKDNDILLYKDGAYIGKVTLFRNGFPFKEYAVNEHVFLLRSNNKDYQNYLYFTLNMPQYFTQMQNLNRNAAQPGLARGDLDRIKILVPNEKVIEKFNKLINPMIDNIFSYSKQITNLTQQRDLLLPRLMSGKLEVDI